MYLVLTIGVEKDVVLSSLREKRKKIINQFENNIKWEDIDNNKKIFNENIEAVTKSFESLPAFDLLSKDSASIANSSALSSRVA